MKITSHNGKEYFYDVSTTNFYLSNKLVNRLNNYCDNHLIKRNRLIEKIIEDHLDKVESAKIKAKK